MVRVDAWVWAVRLTKTRAQAAAACRAGHVKINGESVKPAQHVAVGDQVRVWVNHRERIVEVTELLHKRVGAPAAQKAYIGPSPPPPPQRRLASAPQRAPGAGGPRQAERRQLQNFMRSPRRL